MKRTIYNFYCYHCFKQNISTIPYPIKSNNKKIEQIYCPNCQMWISYKDTNLSTNRYKLVHRNDWCIIDEDTPNQQLVYKVAAHHIAKLICSSLNAGTLSVRQLYHDICFKL